MRDPESFLILDSGSESGMTNKKGKFIIIEGGEGSGKSTIVKYVVEKLKQQRFNIVATREPGGSNVAEGIRAAFLKTKLKPVTQLFCFLAARSAWVEQLLLPNIEKGISVVTDRSYPTTIIYQGINGKIGTGIVNKLNAMAMQKIKPDLVIVLDVKAEEGLKRSKSTGDTNAFEEEGINFHKQANKNYLSLAKKYHWHVVDAMQPLERVKKEVLNSINAIITK